MMNISITYLNKMLLEQIIISVKKIILISLNSLILPHN
nr:MAG TPA: hypothetical protein [Caudoviricetes sp.]